MTEENKYTAYRKIGEEEYEVWNIVYKEKIGMIRRHRVGTWMHWCFFPDYNTWFSNGCLKEISKFITSLYGKKC